MRTSGKRHFGERPGLYTGAENAHEFPPHPLAQRPGLRRERVRPSTCVMRKAASFLVTHARCQAWRRPLCQPPRFRLQRVRTPRGRLPLGTVGPMWPWDSGGQVLRTESAQPVRAVAAAIRNRLRGMGAGDLPPKSAMHIPHRSRFPTVARSMRAIHTTARFPSASPSSTWDATNRTWHLRPRRSSSAATAAWRIRRHCAAPICPASRVAASTPAPRFQVGFRPGDGEEREIIFRLGLAGTPGSEDANHLVHRFRAETPRGVPWKPSGIIGTTLWARCRWKRPMSRSMF